MADRFGGGRMRSPPFAFAVMPAVRGASAGYDSNTTPSINLRLRHIWLQILLPRISSLIHFSQPGVNLEAKSMNVIVFASRKGGSGKSTLAAHLAAHVHKTTKPCLLVDGDPQGSLTLWHKLRGTNEPPIRTAIRSVGEIVATAKRDGIEWVFIDTP